jgi:pimeloyl-ACP methyl ester carboxylesterase
MTTRETVDAGGVPISYLTAGEGFPLVLLLHGTYWSLAGAADNRYTQEMLPALLQSRTPKLPVWGEDDPFQTIDYAERYARDIPETRLVRLKSAGHIPMENDPKAVAEALAEFFAAER